MGGVVANLAMSLDGFIADDKDGVDALFGFYTDGPVEVPNPSGPTLWMSETSAAVYRTAVSRVGAYVVGRRLFDLTEGWGGHPPTEGAMVVLTHHVPERSPFPWPEDGVPLHFADDVRDAVALARQLAGDRDVAVAGGATARACLDAGLLTRIVVSLVPVVLGSGIPWFAGARGPVRLSDPEIVEAEGVTHLSYEVEPA